MPKGRCLQYSSLTFTNKAAAEMAPNRIESLAVLRLEIRGWEHSLGLQKILRVEFRQDCYPSNSRFYGPQMIPNFSVRNHLSRNATGCKVYKANAVPFQKSFRRKKIGWSLGKPIKMIHLSKQMTRQRWKPKNGWLSTRNYQDRLFKAGAMDFDDVLLILTALQRSSLMCFNK